jgi:hypothetical protein
MYVMFPLVEVLESVLKAISVVLFTELKMELRVDPSISSSAYFNSKTCLIRYISSAPFYMHFLTDEGIGHT